MTLAKVIINLYDHENVLKGQHRLAQGFGVSAQPNGNALGINAMTKIVRAIMAEKGKFSFRTKGMIPISQQIMSFYSVRNNFFCLFHPILTDGFGCDSFAPGYAILPLSGRGNPDALQ